MTYSYTIGKKAATLDRYTGGNEQYCRAREWWLEHPRCSERELQEYLIHDFGFIADSSTGSGTDSSTDSGKGSADVAERAHKIAVCLCESKPRQTTSIGSVSLLVALLALVISICSAQFNKYPELVGEVLLAAICLVVLFTVVWVVIKIKTDRRLTLDTEFRGRLSAL